MKLKKCKYCGSQNILADAYVKWNPEEDEWEIDNIFDSYFCDDCEQSSDIVDEEEI